MRNPIESLAIEAAQNAEQEHDLVRLSWRQKPSFDDTGHIPDNPEEGQPFEKAFRSMRRYTIHGVEDVKEIGLKENLVIRGDNLPALRLLRQRYASGIRLIYIDPPYNTETDVFHYADNLSRPEWLSFIGRRVYEAKELLTDDGFLFFHISFHQYAYAKVLLDEIFDGNHVATFNLLVRHPDRILKGDKDFHDVVEYLLVYTHSKTRNKIARRRQQTDFSQYVYEIQEKAPGNELVIDGEKVLCFSPGEYELVKGVPGTGKLQKISIRGSLKEGNSSGRFYMKHLHPLKGQWAPGTLFRIPGIGNDRFDHRYFYLPEESKVNGGYFQGVPLQHKGYVEKPYPNFIDLVKPFNQVGYEGGVQFRNGKKPEALLRFVFELGKLKPGDTVLDFFLGSGTTAATAHKMGFHYIGIEQTDYDENDCLSRLARVIAGTDQRGISREQQWHGGGQFVYAELQPDNE